jgi:hypothetical protein
MIHYVEEFPPVRERTTTLSEYVSTFHNAVTTRTGRGTTVVYGQHWHTVVEDPTEAFLDYLFAVAFVVGTDHPEFHQLLQLGMTSVLLTPPQDPLDWKTPCALYHYLRKKTYEHRTYQRILDEFVPPNLHPSFPCVVAATTLPSPSFTVPFLVLKVMILLLAWSVMGYKWKLSKQKDKEENK